MSRTGILVAAAACALLGASSSRGESTSPTNLAPAAAQRAMRSGPSQPLLMAMQSSTGSQPPPETVYAPPEPPAEGEGINQGAVHTELTVRYMSDYVFRGLDRSDGQGFNSDPSVPQSVFSKAFGSEDAPNLQVDGKISFDLGKLPHPYVGVFTNVYNSDPVSRFQEVRPNFGAVWTLRPFIIDAGQQTFIFPEREELNTAEVYGKITLDDSYFLHTERPIFSPYILTAYDYDRYNGWYFEGGLQHDFVFEDIGLTISAVADVAYIIGLQGFSADGMHDGGWQHYDFGLIAHLSMNDLLHFSSRYGEWGFEGYLFYTDGMNNDLLSTTQLWGGAGISFRY